MTGTAAPPSPETYRLKAEECVRLAAKADDPAVRDAFESAARGWRFLADQRGLLDGSA